MRRDLFDDFQSRYLADASLLRKLAADKLESLATGVRIEGWAWVEARVEFDSQALRQFAPCESTVRDAQPQEVTELAQLDARESELDRQAEALDAAPEWSPDAAECMGLEEQDIAARPKVLHEARKTWVPEAMAHAGAIVTVIREGDPEVIRGLVRDADRKALAASRGAQPDSKSGVADAGDTGEAPRAQKREHSDSLTRRLLAHRTAAMQVVLYRNPQIALAVLTHAFVERVFEGDRYGPSSLLQVTPSLPTHALLAAADDLMDSGAWRAVEAMRVAWLERIPRRSGDRLAWLIALSQDQLLELLALCAASTLNTMTCADGADDLHVIAEATNLSMADWWEPTASGYLSHVSKARILQALCEAGPELAGNGVAAMKKEALVVEAASRLAGKRWLPAPLRSPMSR